MSKEESFAIINCRDIPGRPGRPLLFRINEIITPGDPGVLLYGLTLKEARRWMKLLR